MIASAQTSSVPTTASELLDRSASAERWDILRWGVENGLGLSSYAVLKIYESGSLEMMNWLDSQSDPRIRAVVDQVEREFEASYQRSRRGED